MDFEARQAAIKDLLTCPICKKLCRKVTIIEECCHRYCKKCITRKIKEENIRCCPVCNLDLGCAPLQKLSPDNRWQSFRNKFSEKRNELIERGLIKAQARKPEAEVEAKVPEVLPSVVPSAARQKERSLSSFSQEPEPLNQTSMPGRRKRGGRKHPSQRTSLPSMRLTGEEEDFPESPRESTEKRFGADQFNQETPNTGEEHRSKSQLEQMNLLLTPLNDMLLDVVITKSKDNRPAATPAPSGIHGDEAAKSRLKLKGSAQNLKFVSDGKCHARSDSLRLGKMHQESAPVSLVFSFPAQSVVDATSSNRRERENPVWFSLIASEQQDCRAPLPQIHPCYLRVKDANLPVSYIRKYLARKLDLNGTQQHNNTNPVKSHQVGSGEVEVILNGQPLFRGWRLHEVMELWLRTMPKNRRTTFVGNSAEDFMMVLSYASPRPHQPA